MSFSSLSDAAGLGAFSGLSNATGGFGNHFGSSDTEGSNSPQSFEAMKNQVINDVKHGDFEGASEAMGFGGDSGSVVDPP